MTRPGLNQPPRRNRIGLIAAGTIPIAVLGFLYLRRFEARTWDASLGDNPLVIVSPMRATSPPKGWSADSFADSLAAHLNMVGTVDASSHTVPERNADFVVEGDTRAEGAQTVVALRVRPANQRAAIWNATFWRSSLADPSLPHDLAEAVADALNRKKPHVEEKK